MRKQLGTFVSDQNGSTVIEYGALAMLVGLALVLVLEGVGTGLEGTFAQIKTVFVSAVPAAAN